MRLACIKALKEEPFRGREILTYVNSALMKILEELEAVNVEEENGFSREAK